MYAEDLRSNTAVEALYPILVKKGLPKAASEYGHVFFPLHMPTFMQEADFAKHWWPTFKRMVEEYASMGIHFVKSYVRTIGIGT